MGGYIGAKTGTLVASASDIRGDISATDTTPEITLKNTTETDADGTRSGKITFKGEQSGGEESVLAQIQGSHDGTADDEKGDLIFKTNDGSDGSSPTERLRIDSTGKSTFKDDVGIEGETPTLQMYDTNVTNNVMDVSYDEYLTLDIDPNNVRGNSGLIVKSDGNERMRIDSDGQVGIGVTPVRNFHLHESTASQPVVFAMSTNGTGATTGDGFNISIDGSSGAVNLIQRENESMQFYTNGGANERMRIDSNGNLLVGKTSASSTTAGFQTSQDGQTAINRSGAALQVGRLSSDGDVIEIRKDGSTVGTLASRNGNALVISTNNGSGINFGAANLNPWYQGAITDNITDIGQSAHRWDDIYATNTSIIGTSDENEKQDIASLTSAEITAATAISKLFKTFKWKDAVTKKGDAARTHTGHIAQQVETAMSDAGLDASKYAFWCSNTWWESDKEGELRVYKTKDEAPDGATERTRLGIRYPELLAFIGAATEQRLTSIEARLDALEAE